MKGNQNPKGNTCQPYCVNALCICSHFVALSFSVFPSIMPIMVIGKDNFEEKNARKDCDMRGGGGT